VRFERAIASWVAERVLDRPAAANVAPRFATMAQHLDIGATGVFERVGQDRQLLEGALGEDGLRQSRHGPIVPGEPGRIRGLSRERIEDLPHGETGEGPGFAAYSVARPDPSWQQVESAGDAINRRTEAC